MTGRHEQLVGRHRSPVRLGPLGSGVRCRVAGSGLVRCGRPGLGNGAGSIDAGILRRRCRGDTCYSARPATASSQGGPGLDIHAAVDSVDHFLSQLARSADGHPARVCCWACGSLRSRYWCRCCSSLFGGSYPSPSPERPLLFLIDTSGSMSIPDAQNGPTPNSIGLAGASAKGCRYQRSFRPGLFHVRQRLQNRLNRQTNFR